MIHDLPRLRQTLGAPELAWLVERLRQRLERGEDLAGSVSLADPTPQQRRACDRLVGRAPTRGATTGVDLHRLEDVLRQGRLCDTLREAVEAVAGPVADRRAERQEAQRQWQELFERAAACCGSRAPLGQWLADLAASGLLRRLAARDADRARMLLEQAIKVLDRLPADGVLLAELAAKATGDSHALDADTPLSTLCLRAVAALGGVEISPGAQGRRDGWDSVGVVLDELCGPAIALNLRAEAGNAVGRVLSLHSDAGEPCFLTVRQLRHNPPSFKDYRGRMVFVCENVAVLAAAADRLGPGSAPLVCGNGQPSTAVRLLLGLLRNAGADLRYHGDFDWGGLRIANLLVRRHGVRPWRFGTTDYQAACHAGKPLAGTPVDACWDAELRPAMMRSARAVHEEQIMDQLVEDLACAAESRQ